MKDCAIVLASRDALSTHAYRRVTALLKRGVPGSARVNAKRVYRFMRENNLLLERHSAKPDRAHDGKIIALASNLRWCSDGF